MNLDAANARLRAGLPVYATYSDGYARVTVPVAEIINRGLGDYAVVSATQGVSLAMPLDRITFTPGV